MIDYKDFWLRIERRDDGFWVTSRSPAGGETSAPFVLPPSLEEASISGLLASQRGDESRGDATPSGRETRYKGGAQKHENVGGELFGALFNGPIRDSFNRNWGSGKEGGVRIRLQTDLSDPQLAKLAALPWELLYNEGTRTALGRSKLTPIVRYLDVPLSYEAYPFEGTLRVLIVLANPEGTHPLDLAKEKESIEKTWAQLDGVEVTIIEHATSDAMFDKLDTGTYHVLHYMGHGGFDSESGEGVLLLEDEEGGEAPLSGTMLGETLYGMPSMRLVFLNACDTGKTSHEQGLDPFSGVASALVMGGVPAVVAMQVPVSDEAAVEFADKFYTQLAAREPVDAAVAVGRRAIHRANPTSLEWATPVLFMRAPDGRLFDPPQSKSGPKPERKKYVMHTIVSVFALLIVILGVLLFQRNPTPVSNGGEGKEPPVKQLALQAYTVPEGSGPTEDTFRLRLEEHVEVVKGCKYGEGEPIPNVAHTYEAIGQVLRIFVTSDVQVTGNLIVSAPDGYKETPDIQEGLELPNPPVGLYCSWVITDSPIHEGEIVTLVHSQEPATDN